MSNFIFNYLVNTDNFLPLNSPNLTIGSSGAIFDMQGSKWLEISDIFSIKFGVNTYVSIDPGTSRIIIGIATTVLNVQGSALVPEGYIVNLVTNNTTAWKWFDGGSGTYTRFITTSSRQFHVDFSSANTQFFMKNSDVGTGTMVVIENITGARNADFIRRSSFLFRFNGNGVFEPWVGINFSGDEDVSKVEFPEGVNISLKINDVDANPFLHFNTSATKMIQIYQRFEFHKANDNYIDVPDTLSFMLFDESAIYAAITQTAVEWQVMQFTISNLGFEMLPALDNALQISNHMLMSTTVGTEFVEIDTALLITDQGMYEMVPVTNIVVAAAENRTLTMPEIVNGLITCTIDPAGTLQMPSQATILGASTQTFILHVINAGAGFAGIGPNDCLGSMPAVLAGASHKYLISTDGGIVTIYTLSQS